MIKGGEAGDKGITIMEVVKGVVRSKIGYVKGDGLGETLLFTRTKLT